ncbi:MAG: 50S ribosomal protein L11 methyltransferase [Gammaproteobacteria bacterium]|nr:50S ribosomal protein L11 methyltransferase [Gammaproteobacteria bacterium]
MPYTALILNIDGLNADAVEAACIEAGAISLSYSDQRDDAILEPAPGEFRLWPATRIQALFMHDALTPEILSSLSKKIDCGIHLLKLKHIEDRIWEREWLRDFHPMCFGKRLWICPTHASVDESGAIVVRLEPGLAFGTGTHPTTRLCLEFLDARHSSGKLCIDYGCGSGVLAIAALQLGAQHVFAHDIDPQALVATQDNALKNNLVTKITLFESAEKLSDAATQINGADLLLANILSGPLCKLAPQLTNLLAQDGELVLAGLLTEQVDEVTAAYSPWLKLSIWKSLDGWSCLTGSKNKK